MAVRYFRRRRAPFRKTFRRRMPSGVVAGGQVKRVAGASSRNAPIYTIQPARVAHKKLIHIVPLVSTITQFSANDTIALTPTANFNTVSLNSIEQGDGLDKRHANKIWMTELTVIYSFGTGFLNTNVDLPLNVMVWYDRECRGSLAAIGDILDGDDTLHMQRIENRERFDIIYRGDPTCAPQRVYNGTTVLAYPSDSSSRHRSFKIPIMRGATYNGTTAGISTILKGALYLTFFNNATPGATNIPIFATHRLMFSDIE